MSNRLAFQTQLASIMEVLANAAVAEICKLVDDDYAVVSLQMSQCQRENKALKRKLHLLELKMARGNAERRLRESAMNSRPKVQIHTGDKLRGSLPSSCGVFDRHVSLWSGTPSAVDAESEPIQPESIQSKSPDVELVEPEALMVKEERVEANMSQFEETEEDVALIGDDGVLECVPRAAAGQRPSLRQQDIQPTSSQLQSQAKLPSTSRGVEDDSDVVLVKVEEGESVTGTTPNKRGASIQEGLVESSTDDYKGVLPYDESTQMSTNHFSDMQDSGRSFSEAAKPQLNPVLSDDSKSIVAIQLKVLDTNTANPASEQQHKSSSNSLSSEYSLFELENFFTRWAPDNDSVSVPSAPSCSFTIDNIADCDRDVILVETQPVLHQVPLSPLVSEASAAKLSEGQSFSSAASHCVSQGTSVPTSLKMQTLTSQAPWSRAAAIIKGAQTQPQRQHHNANRVSQQQHSALCSSTALACTDKISAISSTSRTMSSSVAPQSLPVRSTTALAGTEVTIAVQRHNNKIQAASIVLGERRRKSYVCQTCAKVFYGLSNLEAHERVHTGEKPFRCDTCGKRFSEAGNLKKHQRVHTGEKPFSCDQCGKRFAWICNLRTHQQSVTGCGAQARGGLGMRCRADS
ncbi:transcriptional regulator CRZ2-like [Parambassis ranga]|uniref:Transcriptional regulator CRZ2-like n=1 Tax=Parambassis ranga TaxID=210632 RepID=A0A6P7HHE1_9TELE|nr:transcriptional regulator CRZ2-like [Parambassis ranga]